LADLFSVRDVDRMRVDRKRGVLGAGCGSDGAI
jgi:hypothetical protein